MLTFTLTFPYGGQQVQATVCVQSLQQAHHSLSVWVVQLKTQITMLGTADANTATLHCVKNLSLNLINRNQLIADKKKIQELIMCQW